MAADGVDGKASPAEPALRRETRPWGWYASVDQGPGHQVKRIHVEPGQRLSLQLHHRRAEHWVVIRGLAEVTVGDRIERLAAGQTVFIPVGEKHRLANPGTDVLEIVEVQLGDYLGEDDIVRFEDAYGRA